MLNTCIFLPFVHFLIPHGKRGELRSLPRCLRGCATSWRLRFARSRLALRPRRLGTRNFLGCINQELIFLMPLVLLLLLPLSATAQDEMRIGYLRHWPTPNLYDGAYRTLDPITNTSVQWYAFDTGAEIATAMAKGEIDIAYSQGVTPFVQAVSEGLDIVTIGIAVSYAENDNCVVHDEAGIDKSNAPELEGKKVAVPFGSVPHYKLLKQFDHLGVDHRKVVLLDMTPNQGADALARAEVTMACGFGGGFTRMLQYGTVLLTAQELADIGIYVFDIIAVTRDFAQNHPDWVQAFLQVTEDSNHAFAEDPDKFITVLAGMSEQTPEVTKGQLENFIFPAKSEVLNRWFNGSVAEFYHGVAHTLYEAEVLSTVLEDYAVVIDPRFLAALR